MRPEHEAPENGRHRPGHRPRCRPSMRPEHEAPENSGSGPGLRLGAFRFNETGPRGSGKPAAPQERAEKRSVPSMRPEHEAPENFHAVKWGRTRYIPSMRPEHEAPENLSGRSRSRNTASPFNEAGARSSGKPGREGADCAAGDPSMRPEHEAPENLWKHYYALPAEIWLQ